jgi:DNA-binding PadR family transcriptional regulator
LTHQDQNKKPTAKGYSSKDLETRIVKNFLDILILIEIKKQVNITGYDITAFINSKFGGIVSPGTVYPTLYSLERKGLIESETEGRKTVFKLSPSGQDFVDDIISNFCDEMAEFLKKFVYP